MDVGIFPLTKRNRLLPAPYISPLSLSFCFLRIWSKRMDDNRRNPSSDDEVALRRIQRLSLHLYRPSATLSDELSLVPCRARRNFSASVESLSEYMRGPHREIQARIFEFFQSRPDLQTPVEISMAEHRELCMRQMMALVREAGIRPFRCVSLKLSIQLN